MRRGHTHPHVSSTYNNNNSSSYNHREGLSQSNSRQSSYIGGGYSRYDSSARSSVSHRDERGGGYESTYNSSFMSGYDRSREPAKTYASSYSGGVYSQYDASDPRLFGQHVQCESKYDNNVYNSYNVYNPGYSYNHYPVAYDGRGDYYYQQYSAPLIPLQYQQPTLPPTHTRYPPNPPRFPTTETSKRRSHSIDREPSKRPRSFEHFSHKRTPTPPSRGGFQWTLPPHANTDFAAAGIVLYSTLPNGSISFLLGEEDRSKKKKGRVKNVWLNFGGKVERGEVLPSQTALREFTEETGGLFTEKEIESIKRTLSAAECPKFWVETGKYVLFFVEFPYDETIPQRFEELDSKNPESTQTELKWCDAKAVVRAVIKKEKYFELEGSDRQYTFFPYFLDLLGCKHVLQFLRNTLKIY
eukprot:TRINITY_DN3863_c0_g1_i3.p1 TRINITY_DN3863_c0_g1~~TRINITY_DN3863_c0_g1_i3.p1  ORF type:complete len:413 (-),score=65.74 TRINITY_DN3863_c0_g1_i3:197-1435(-)